MSTVERKEKPVDLEGLDLATLWRPASQWYAGRLDYGYTRRDPGEASDYLRQAGLTGPFWGL